jgi:hypothetical protein
MGPIFFRPQVNRYVTLFVERSGSTYLATALASHPEIKALREELADLRQKGAQANEQLSWVNEFFNTPFMGPYKAYGFKTKIVDILDPDGFANLLKAKGCRIIQLLRRNTVKAAISTINARRMYQASGNWNLLSEADRQPAFEVDVDEFDVLIRQRQGWDRELQDYVNKLDLPTLQLYYEDLLKDESSFLGSVFEFLEVAPRPVKGKTLKNTEDDLRKAIINLDELRSRYEGTPFTAMFDEVLV